ncbi:MAG: hypothetical protein ACE5HC_03310 [Candidatus Binatia bacterium]
MKLKSTRIFLSLGVLILGGILTVALPEVQADDEFTIKIGPAAPSVAKHAHKLEITAFSLKQGKGDYKLGSRPEDSHAITLTQEQVADLLDGTTVIVESGKDPDSGEFKAHRHRVALTLKDAESTSSGW